MFLPGVTGRVLAVRPLWYIHWKYVHVHVWLDACHATPVACDIVDSN